MPSMTAAFSSPAAPIYTTIIEGSIISLVNPGLAKVNGHIVTDFDCNRCGEDVGRASGRMCDHQRLMMLAIIEYIDEELPQPFDKGSERGWRRWQTVVDALEGLNEM